MSRRSICQFVVMFLLGVGWTLYDKTVCLGAAGVFFCYLLWHVIRHITSLQMRRCVLLVGCCFFVLGSIRGAVAQLQQEKCRDMITKGAVCSFQGKLYQIRQKEETKIYYLQDVILQREGEKLYSSSIILTSVSEEIPIGTKVTGYGRADPFARGRNEGNFDERAYYESMGITARLKNVCITGTIRGKGSILPFLMRLRERMQQVYIRELPGEEAGVLSAICLGEKELLAPEAKELFQLAGLSHLLAISGLHISLVGLGIYRLLRRCGAGFFFGSLISGGLLLLYAVMSGMSVSTQRAFVMFLLSLVAGCLGRSYDTLCALAASAGILIWREPALLGNSGFLFSFLTVLGIASLCKTMTIGKGKAASALLSAAMIQLVTLPLLATFYFEIPIYSMLLNTLLLPSVGLLLGCGLAGGLAGCVWPLLGRLFLFPCHLLLFFYEMAADISLRLPGARQITGCPPQWRVVVYYILLLLLIYGFDRKKRSVAQQADVKKEAVMRRAVIRHAAAEMTILAGLVCFLLWRPLGGFEVTMLDVGQGEGIFFRSGEGVSFFVDGGSTSVKDAGRYRILPFLKYRGIRRMDYWLISHTDEDHISGLREALEEGYPIDTLVFAKAMDTKERKELCRLAEKNKTKVLYFGEGDKIFTDSLTLTCLYPGEQEIFEGANENSMVLLLEQEHFRMLLTGDLGEEQEQWLAKRWSGGGQEKSVCAGPGKVDVLKVAHHGSRYSSSEALLSLLQPDIALISAGEHNFYGHPAPETIERLGETGSVIYCTVNTGQIRITLCREGVKAEPFLTGDFP